MADTDVIFSSATELARRIRSHELSAREVMGAYLAHIERVNPSVNAIVSQIPEEDALKAADEADERLTQGEPVGPLHGLPIAHKDLVLTRGIRTTWGSPIYKEFVPRKDDLIVERLKQAGMVTIACTGSDGQDG